MAACMCQLSHGVFSKRSCSGDTRVQIIHRPKGFVHKQRRVRGWLQDVRRTYSRAHTGPGKQCVKTFLLSNADYEHVESFMAYA